MTLSHAIVERLHDRPYFEEAASNGDDHLFTPQMDCRLVLAVDIQR